MLTHRSTKMDHSRFEHAANEAPNAAKNPRQIRLLNGPMRDSSHEISGRMTIGREEVSDILLLHNGVSRQHACIISDADGNHILLDLGSTNGTFVDGERVDRQPLTLGMTFVVAGCKMQYEEAPIQISSHFQRPGTVAPLRPEVSNINRIGQALPNDTDSVESRSEPKKEPEYDGDLIGDIARYRMIRTRRLRGGPDSTLDDPAFDKLEARMRPSNTNGYRDERRSYNRFSCSITCTVRMTSGEEIPGAVVDIGVDGARIAVADPCLAANSMIWVKLERKHSKHVRTLVFSARVAWVATSNIGVAFSGAPGWSKANARSRRPTQRVYPIGRLHLVRKPQGGEHITQT